MPVKSSCNSQPQQNLAIANCLAQAEAFALGQAEQQVREELTRQKLPPERIQELVPHKLHEGSRPLSLYIFERLDPATLGRIIALYEHKVFVEAAVWNINPFDQWGVELGKELASRLAPIVTDPSADISALDPSTGGLIAHLRTLRS
jgi:glucose-6-phosphate isomerase